MNINARSGQFNDDGTIDVRVTLHDEGAIEMTFEEQRIDTKLGPRDIDSLIGQLKCIRSLFTALPEEPDECGVYYGAASEGIALRTPEGKWVYFDDEAKDGVAVKPWKDLVRQLLPGDLPLRKLSSESLGIASRSMTGR